MSFLVTDPRLRKHIQASRCTSAYRLAGELRRLLMDVSYGETGWSVTTQGEKKSSKPINFQLFDKKEEHSVILIPQLRNESVRTGGPAQVFRNRSMLFQALWQAYSRRRLVEHHEVLMRESWEGEQVEGDRISKTCLQIAIIHIKSPSYDAMGEISGKYLKIL